MTDLIDTILGLLAKGEDIILARVISVQGSSPRETGATMLMQKNGDIDGTVGGGLVEAATLQKGYELFSNRGLVILEFDMTGGNIKEGEMVCGGKMEVLVEFIPSGEDALRMFARINENQNQGHKSFLVTELPNDGGRSGIQRQLICGNQPNAACVMPNQLENTVLSMMKSGMVQMDGKRYWVDLIKSGEVVYLMGAGHVSREVCDLAQRVGFKTVVMDDRHEYANRERFVNASEIVVLKSFEACFDGINMDDNSYVVILTRAHVYDKTVLAQALKTKAGYVGMIGSIRKRDTIYRSLFDEGFTTEQIEQVYCPIGLKMASETPAEIALSIVGELVNVRAGKRKSAERNDHAYMEVQAI